MSWHFSQALLTNKAIYDIMSAWKIKRAANAVRLCLSQNFISAQTGYLSIQPVKHVSERWRKIGMPETEKRRSINIKSGASKTQKLLKNIGQKTATEIINRKLSASMALRQSGLIIKYGIRKINAYAAVWSSFLGISKQHLTLTIATIAKKCEGYYVTDAIASLDFAKITPTCFLSWAGI